LHSYAGVCHTSRSASDPDIKNDQFSDESSYTQTKMQKPI